MNLFVILNHDGVIELMLRADDVVIEACLFGSLSCILDRVYVCVFV